MSRMMAAPCVHMTASPSTCARDEIRVRVRRVASVGYDHWLLAVPSARVGDGAVDLAAALPFLDRLAAVLLRLPARQRDLHLGQAVLEVESRRDQREALFPHALGDPIDLGAVQKELAVAQGLVAPGR